MQNKEPVNALYRNNSSVYYNQKINHKKHEPSNQVINIKV